MTPPPGPLLAAHSPWTGSTQSKSGIASAAPLSVEALRFSAGRNRTSLCLAHHLHGVHKGYVRVRGRAPDQLEWELGEEEDG